jgi:DNA-binding MarR family transcriptional regulator
VGSCSQNAETFLRKKITPVKRSIIFKINSCNSYPKYTVNSCNDILFGVDISMDNSINKPSKGNGSPPGKYISAIYRHLQILIADQLQPFRIGSGQFSFLLTIAGKEGISQKELSEEMLIDKTTTAKAIKKLEAEGYVRRETNPIDNRYHLLYLTEQGKEVLPKVAAVLHDISRKSRVGINDEEYELMLILLKKMLRNMSEQVRQKREKAITQHRQKD